MDGLKQKSMGKKTGSSNILKGSVKSIIPKSGAIERCSECDRALVNDHCPVHIDQGSYKDLRVKAKLGTGEQVIINNGLAERLLGLSIEKAHSLPENKVLGRIKDRIVNREVKVEVTPISSEKDIYSAKDLKITR